MPAHIAAVHGAPHYAGWGASHVDSAYRPGGGARRRAHNRAMNRVTKWALRTVALWAVSKALQLANDSLKQRQRNRQLRARAAHAAALPRTSSRSSDLRPI